MADERVQRRLAAILAADVASYSRLMGEDEEGTLAHLTAHLSELIEPCVADHQGRIVKTTGDGLLAEFASIVDAVRCAIAIQTGMRTRNAVVPPNQRIEFRIGLNIGDMIVQADDVFGDGVNVAARIEGLAEPGGISLSEDAFRQIEGRIDAEYVDAGLQHLKNIDRPVRVYRVRGDGPVRVVVPIGVRLRRWRWPALATVAALVALVLAKQFGVLPIPARAPEPEAVAIDGSASSLPDRPSIAVLPFSNMSDDKTQDYFSEGIADDIITDLSKISGLFVIARNSSFAYVDAAKPLGEVAEELGVKHVLQGSVRRFRDRIRLNVQLVDATTNSTVWAERYDRRLDDVFAVQDEITAAIVEALTVTLNAVDQSKAANSSPKSVEAFDAVLRGRKALSRFSFTAFKEAKQYFERAIELDPTYAEAQARLGWWHVDDWRIWGRSRDTNISAAIRFGRRAAELDPNSVAAQVLLAQAYQFGRAFDEAQAAADRALSLQPNDAASLANLSSMLIYADRAEEAVPLLERAIRLDPFHPPNYLEWLGHAYFRVGRYEDCARAAKRGLALNPDFVALHFVLAECAYGLGDKAMARTAGSEILRTNPGFTIGAFADYVPFRSREDFKKEIEGLRFAGLPE